MAGKTKDELEADIVALKAQLENVPDVGHYEYEIERLNNKVAEEAQRADAAETRLKEDLREREIIAEDQRKAREAKEAQFKELKIEQSEHTRFRIFNRPPSGQRDIFGDPESIVANLGVELQRYSGGVYIPLSVVIEIGQSIGMLTREQAGELNNELETTRAKVESSATLATELQDGIQTLVDRFYSDLNNVVSDDVDSESESDSGAEDAGQAPDSEQREESDGIPSGANDGINDGHEPESGGFFANLR